MSSNTRSTSDAQQQTALTIDPIIYEEPITNILIHSTAIPNMEIDLKLIVYSRARVVKWLSIIDMTFLTISLVLYALNGAFFWIFLPMFLFCFCAHMSTVLQHPAWGASHLKNGTAAALDLETRH